MKLETAHIEGADASWVGVTAALRGRNGLAPRSLRARRLWCARKGLPRNLGDPVVSADIEPAGPKPVEQGPGLRRVTKLLEGKTMGPPNSQMSVSTRLQRIAQLAREAPQRAFLSLAHHIDQEFLREAFRRTRKDGAPGVDGQSGREYEEGLDARRLDSLLSRFKTGTYKAPPVRRVWIPKGDGTQRPLGIPSFEDKVLQRAVAMVLEAVYEQDFLACSHGYRPGRSARTALASELPRCSAPSSGRKRSSPTCARSWLPSRGAESLSIAVESVTEASKPESCRRRPASGSRLVASPRRSPELDRSRLVSKLSEALGASVAPAQS